VTQVPSGRLVVSEYVASGASTNPQRSIGLYLPKAPAAGRMPTSSSRSRSRGDDPRRIVPVGSKITPFEARKVTGSQFNTWCARPPFGRKIADGRREQRLGRSVRRIQACRPPTAQERIDLAAVTRGAGRRQMTSALTSSTSALRASLAHRHALPRRPAGMGTASTMNQIRADQLVSYAQKRAADRAPSSRVMAKPDRPHFGDRKAGYGALSPRTNA